MNDLATVLSTRRELMGLTQGSLASASGVSLPTIQNLEAGKGNPSLQVLVPLLRSLGLEMELRHSPYDWDRLADLGAPLEERAKTAPSPRSLTLLIQNMKLAAVELKSHPEGRNRHQEALQALLIALRDHFPAVYAKHCASSRLLVALTQVPLNGKIIKLRRQALARLVEYL